MLLQPNVILDRMNETKPKTIYALFKVTEYVDSFRSGTLYMNTLKHFRDLKNKEGEKIGDPLEGLSFVGQPHLVRVQVGDHVVDAAELAGPVLASHDHVMDFKAFCMYAINSGDFDHVSKENFERFTEYLKIQVDRLGLGAGGKAVLITNTEEFLARVHSACKREGLARLQGLMHYFDLSDFHGPIKFPGFYKTKEYDAQREWRFVVKVPDGGPHKIEDNGAYKLEIGSIEDISVITTVEEINAKMKYELPEDGVSMIEAPESQSVE